MRSSRPLALILATTIAACASTASAPAELEDAARDAQAEVAAHDDAGAGADDATRVDDVASDVAMESDAASDDGVLADGAVTCAWGGAPGICITTEACAAEVDHASYAGECPGPADEQCCIKTPNPADNPPIPAGWKLMQQADVTADMTAWAVAILHDPTDYPMFSTTTRTFGTLNVLARVEWHPPDFQNSVVHRGVTLYEPA